METIAVVEREEKQARDLRRGDWTALWFIAEVRYAEVYVERGREVVLVVSRDPHYSHPEVDRLDADLRVTLANPDEIPEDAFGSGREVDADVDLSVGIPPFVDGHFHTGRVDHG
jgi:hypothetical protein